MQQINKPYCINPKGHVPAFLKRKGMVMATTSSSVYVDGRGSAWDFSTEFFDYTKQKKKLKALTGTNFVLCVEKKSHTETYQVMNKKAIGVRLVRAEEKAASFAPFQKCFTT